MTFLQRILFALSLSLAFGGTALAQGSNDAVIKATAVLDNMDAGDFETAAIDFNDNLKSQISTTQLAGVQMQLEAAGPVQSRGEPQQSERDGFTVITYRIQREHAALIATVAIDGNGKVAGLHFAPAEGAAQ